MTVGDELQSSLRSMGFLQLLQLLVFVAAYALALGSFVESRDRKRAAGLALLMALGFCLTTTPWVHGVLLMVLLVGALGVFIGIAALVSRLLGVAAGQRVDQPDTESVSDSRGLDTITREGSARPSRSGPRRLSPTRQSH
jgi:hypothetical protein